MEKFRLAVELLPQDLRQAALNEACPGIEEIRLRLGKRPSLVINGTEEELQQRKVNERDLSCVLEKATGASFHTASAAISSGYISYKGIRIGICGTMGTSRDSLASFRNFYSLAIRIPGEHRGICEPFLPSIVSPSFSDTLIISPPGMGKTSLLREMVRCLGDMGYRVGLIDERNEISASYSFDTGRCSDVLCSVPKAQGAMMLLRAMNPEIIAMDEITLDEDIEAVSEICGCGVGILATAHAKDLNQLRQRPLYRRMLSLEIIKCVLTIRRYGALRTYTLERIHM